MSDLLREGEVAGGGPGGEGQGEGEVVMAGRGLVGEAGEFVEQVAAGGQGAGDAQEVRFEKNAEAREEVAAGHEIAAAGGGGGVLAGGDRDGEDGGVQGEPAEEFDNGRADARGVDCQGAMGVGRVAGQDRPRRRAGWLEQAREAAEELEIGHAEGKAVGEADAEQEAGFGLEGDGVGAAGGAGEAFEEDEGGGVVAAAEIESEEEMRLRVRGDGFDGEHGCRQRIVAGERGARRGGAGKWLEAEGIETARVCDRLSGLCDGPSGFWHWCWCWGWRKGRGRSWWISTRPARRS